MAIFKPALKDLGKLRTAPTEGEVTILRYLAQILPNDAMVYFQSKMDYAMPDVVIIRPHHGVAIIEVKDWNLDKYKINRETGNWEVTRDFINWHQIGSPLEQVKCYKDLFFHIYSRELLCRKMENNKIYGLIVPIIFFHGVTRRELEYFSSREKADWESNYIYAISDEDLENGTLKSLFARKKLLGSKSYFFDDELYAIFNRILSPSKHSLLMESLRHIVWTDEQKRYCYSLHGKNIYDSKKKKIRGVAGSGKTTVMARRAVDAFLKTGRTVVILTFNITLCHYIQDCINIFRPKGVAKNNFIVMHFHLFMKLYRNKHNILPKYKNNIPKPEYEIFTFDGPVPEKFSTIYVDEVQDYKKDWIDAIYQLLEDDGEIIFWGDIEQNVYHRAVVMEASQKQLYTGVKGAWNILHKTHRCTGKIADIARCFQMKFFPADNDNKMEVFEGDLFDNTSISYHYFEQNVPNDICRIILEAVREKCIHYDDICIMSEKISTLRHIEQVLRNKTYPTETTFETQEEYNTIRQIAKNLKDMNEKLYLLRRAAKFQFYMERGKIKLTTIHSFKGWGINTEVLILTEPKPGSGMNNELIYTALTRAKQNLIVINIGNSFYHSFFMEPDILEIINR